MISIRNRTSEEKSLLCFIAINLFFSPISSAQTTPSILPFMHENSHLVLSLGGGAAFPLSIRHSQTFPILDAITDEFFIYTANNAQQSVGLFNVFLGVESALHADWALQLGFGYIQPGTLNVQGTFIQGADVQSADNYTYHYNILTSQFMAESKLLYSLWDGYHPYALLGLGASVNQAKDYYTNVPPFLTFTREYENRTTSSFTYTLGLGMDVEVLNNLRIGLGYRYADLGKINLGNARIDTTFVNDTLAQSHKLNEVLAQITFVI